MMPPPERLVTVISICVYVLFCEPVIRRVLSRWPGYERSQGAGVYVAAVTSVLLALPFVLASLVLCAVQLRLEMHVTMVAVLACLLGQTAVTVVVLTTPPSAWEGRRKLRLWLMTHGGEAVLVVASEGIRIWMSQHPPARDKVAALAALVSSNIGW